MIYKGDILSIQCKMSLRGPKYMRKVDGLSLILIYFYVPVLTPYLNSTETSLKFSENTTLFAVCPKYTGVISKETPRHQEFEVYHLYIDCIMWGTGRNLVEPPFVYPLAETFHLRPTF
jgi:hypothetical protein